MPETVAQTTLPADSPASTIPAAPATLGRYLLRRQLGRGGMGTVYLAHDPVLDILVALKVPHPEVVRDAAALERFYREARAVARLDHPNICRIYDVRDDGQHHFLAMAYVEGEPLSSRVADLAADPRRVAEVVRKVALALEEAHQKGIIHRDLKPANIMLNQRGEPIVMDFGLARRLETGAVKQTRHGVVMGTPAYMPPEQATGDVDAIGPGSDVYSLGVVLYELLTGRVPFHGTLTSVLVQVVHDEPPRPALVRPGIDARLEAICLKAMDKQPRRRYTSMADLAAALDDFLQGKLLPAAAAGPEQNAQRLLASVLGEFRSWGWEKGLHNVRGWLPATRDVEPEVAELLLRWLGGEESLHDPVTVRLGGADLSTLAAWTLAGRALAAARSFRLSLAQRETERAAAAAHPPDAYLDATLAYLRAYVLSRLGRWEEAVPLLHQALGQFGRAHILTGAVLDIMGRVYAGKCNFQAAREFYKHAIVCKQQAGDEAGLIVSYEELGRLYLDWDQGDAAEEHLSAGLRVAQKFGDEGGQAQLLNHLGRVTLARAERETALGRKAAARRLWKQAGDYLGDSIDYYQRHGRTVPEGRARKYLALVHLNEGDEAAAEEALRRAEELVRAAGHEQGVNEVRWFFGRLRRAQGRSEEAVQMLRQAVAGYDTLHQQAEGARAQLELARALAEARAAPRLVVQALEEALRRAEAGRRGDLVESIEEELRGVDEEALWRHVFRRVRGHGAPEATASLSSGTSEMATVLFLSLKDFVPFCQGLDPEEVMLTLNQLLADLEGVLVCHGAQVMSYLGGGFMALLRQADHAERALAAALDLLAVLAEFNRPRAVLDLRQLPAWVGVASGPVFLGNIGTYRKMSFTAVGAAVNLAARLMRQASEDAPCVSQETRELAGDRFVYRADDPRHLDLEGIGRRPVWDLVGRKPKQPSGFSGRV